ncbi:MAG: hypothetical protein K8963_00170 [Proteobacteria bacterium]|nr:hypothetical protein [Pseudomonadota bacterium]
MINTAYSTPAPADTRVASLLSAPSANACSLLSHSRSLRLWAPNPNPQTPLPTSRLQQPTATDPHTPTPTPHAIHATGAGLHPLASVPTVAPPAAPLLRHGFGRIANGC